LAAGNYRTPAEYRLFRDASYSASEARKGAANVTTLLGSTTAASLVEYMGNSLTDLAQGYDDRRRAAGLSANPELTKPTRDLAARLTLGKPETSDIDLIVTKAVGLKIIKEEDTQNLYDALLYESEGQSPD
jgi:hypothetical protein